jgi:hypothetical protein
LDLTEFKCDPDPLHGTDNSHNGNENNEDKQEREGEGDEGREGDEKGPKRRKTVVWALGELFYFILRIF